MEGDDGGDGDGGGYDPENYGWPADMELEELRARKGKPSGAIEAFLSRHNRQRSGTASGLALGHRWK